MLFFWENQRNLQRSVSKGFHKIPREERNHVKLFHIPHMFTQYDRHGNIEMPAGLYEPF